MLKAINNFNNSFLYSIDIRDEPEIGRVINEKVLHLMKKMEII